MAMGPCPTCLLVLVLCLGQAVHMQNRVLPKPSIRAEPGPVICRGRPATIVCRGPDWAELFRLEDETGYVHGDQRHVPQRGSHWAEATFHIDTQNEFTRSYFCRYHKGPRSWSEPSDILKLKVTVEDVFHPPSGGPRVVCSTPFTKPPSTAGHMQTKSRDTNTSGLLTEHLYILIGICVASLLCLLLLALLLVYRQHRKKRGPPSSKGEEPRPQERLSPTADLTARPAEEATTVDALPEENGDMHSPSPAAGDPQEVTYAQLDQRALTRRAARAESPQPTEPTAESSMYAALPRH